MHADVVPTMLAAAQVRYQQTERAAVNLLENPVPPRKRVVQKAVGAAVSWDALVLEAAEHRLDASNAQASAR
jgi:hypothetical protein